MLPSDTIEKSFATPAYVELFLTLFPLERMIHDGMANILSTKNTLRYAFKLIRYSEAPSPKLLDTLGIFLFVIHEQMIRLPMFSQMDQFSNSSVSGSFYFGWLN